MGFLIVFLIGVGAISAWWLSQQRLTSKPWLEESPAGQTPLPQTPGIPAEKIGLGVFLAVAGSLFALMFSAAAMQIQIGGPQGLLCLWTLGTWTPLPVPKVLWINTAILIFSSFALQSAHVAAQQGAQGAIRTGLLAGAASALAFVVGQLIAWKQLTAAGYVVAASQASAMFYLLTATHGVHVLGGLAVLAGTAPRAWNTAPGATCAIQLSVHLCAIYWHFLLVVWLVLFGTLIFV